jgi:hypothetical protein
MQRPRLAEPRRVRFQAAFVGWAITAAAVLVMAFGVWHHRPDAAPSQANTLQPQAADTEAQIAQDNQLMEAVNAAISPNEASPIEEYKILESAKPHPEAYSKKRMR